MAAINNENLIYEMLFKLRIVSAVQECDARNDALKAKAGFQQSLKNTYHSHSYSHLPLFFHKAVIS